MSPGPGPHVPPELAQALGSLRDVRVRPDVDVREIPSPSRVAPYSLAVSGELLAGPRGGVELASGRFVVLYDPDGQDVWEGRFRVVTLVRGAIEHDLAHDPLLTEIAWSWLREAHALAGARAHAAGGTVTRVLSESFGALAEQPEADEVEIRASWSPSSADLAPHLTAWSHLMGAVAGRPALPDGVTPLRGRRVGA